MLSGFVIAAGIITWQEIHNCHTLPWPPRYVGAAIVFGTLDLLSPVISPELAGLIGFGIVIAFIINGTLNPKTAVGCDHGGTPQPPGLVSLTQQNANANVPASNNPPI
jgi:hypothetical protein